MVYFIAITVIMLLTIPQGAQALSWNDVTSVFTSAKEDSPIKKEFAVTPDVFIELESMSGDVTVKTWNQPIVSLEAIKRGSVEQLQATNVRITASPKQIQITTSVEHDKAAIVTYNLMVPKTASLTIALSQRGAIKIKKVEGSISVKTHEGPITIHGSVGSIVAKTTYGAISLKAKELPAKSSLFLETFKGAIELMLPSGTNAHLNARTVQGTVTSTIPLTLTPQTLLLNRESWARFKKEALGTLGNGGAPITIESTKGNIIITENNS